MTATSTCLLLVVCFNRVNNIALIRISEHVYRQDQKKMCFSRIVEFHIIMRLTTKQLLTLPVGFEHTLQQEIRSPETLHHSAILTASI